ERNGGNGDWQAVPHAGQDGGTVKLHAFQRTTDAQADYCEAGRRNRHSPAGGAAGKGWFLMAFMKRARLLSLAAVLALLISACVPGAGPRLRVIHGQTWGADFNVEVTRSGRSGLVLPVTLELAFSQRLNDITADASLAYNTALFRINTGDTTLTGHLGIDGSLNLNNPNRSRGPAPGTHALMRSARTAARESSRARFMKAMRNQPFPAAPPAGLCLLRRPASQ